MGTRVSGKAILHFVLVAIIIASVTASMMCSISAYSVGGPYNIIEKQPSVQTVLLGQDLEFSNTDWTAPPVVNRYVSRYLETTYTATEKNGQYYIDTTNWRASGTFYVNGEPGGYEAQLSAEEPDMPLKLTVMDRDVSSLARGTMLTVDVGGINLNDEDRVDLAIIGPEGQITEKNTQQFKGITVSKLKDLIIDTTSWDLGHYTFQVKSQPDNACGLDAQSVKRELNILKSEVRIKADTTEVPELENVKLTVMGVPGHRIEIKSDPFSTNAYFPTGLDDNPTDKTTFTFNDIIDDDGVRGYVAEFNDPGLYTIRVTDLDESDSYDSVDITITEKLEATPKLKSTPTIAPTTSEQKPEPTPTAAPIPPLSFQELIDEELMTLSPGRILFDHPEKMKVGIEERVVVRLTKDITENLTEGLKVAGAPQIEPIELGTFMTVKLTGGDSFDIKALSTEEQVVKPVGFTEWSWDVRPLKSGRQELHLTVTVRILISGQDEQKIDWPVMDKQISVEVNPPYTFKRFIECYWQWIVATIISAIAVIPIIIKMVGRTRKK